MNLQASFNTHRLASAIASKLAPPGRRVSASRISASQRLVSQRSARRISASDQGNISQASFNVHQLASAIASKLAPPGRRVSASRISASGLGSAIAHRLTKRTIRSGSSHASLLTNSVASRFASHIAGRHFASQVNRKLASAVAKSLATSKDEATPSTADLLASAISAKMFNRRTDGEKDELPVAKEDVGAK